MPNGGYEVTSFWKLLLNPWGLLQYAHNMCGAVVTAAFVMSAVGAFYLLEKRFEEYGRSSSKSGVIGGADRLRAAMIFPTGDLHGTYVAQHQPVSNGRHGRSLPHARRARRLVLMGQPNERRRASTIRWSSTRC